MLDDLLRDLLILFRDTKRIGCETDDPEGARCIMISETIAEEFENRLEVECQRRIQRRYRMS